MAKGNLLDKHVNIGGDGSMQSIHFIPWKPKIVMVTGENGEVTPTEEAMTWVDAAKVALILSLVEFFVDYSMQSPFPYPGCTMIMLQVWFIQGFFFMARKFMVLFVSLTGLTMLGSAALKKAKKEK